MKKNIAVVGGGYWGKNLIRNFHELGALRGICDQNPQTLADYVAQYPDLQVTNSYSDILRDRAVEGVVLATPAITHYEMTRQALAADKDVFVEKPLALERKQGEELVALAGKAGKMLMVGHLLRYHPAVKRLKELVDAGRIGKLQYFYSNRLNIGKIRSEENILWSFAPHDISVMLMLLGESPIAVSARGGNYLHQDRADVTMSTFTFRSGVNAHIFVSWLHPYKEQRLVVVGDKGMLVFNDVDPINKILYYGHQIDWIDRKPVARKADAEPIPVDAEEPLNAECRHFINSMANRSQPWTNGEEGLAVLTVLEACQTSLERSGAAVTLGSTTPPVAPRNYFVHESAIVDAGCEIGEGTKVWHFSHVLKGSVVGENCNIGQNVVIGPNVVIGNKVKIQNNVSVYQGVVLEDEVFCGPSMVFTNVINPRSGIVRMHEIRRTLVKRGASIGANATIVCGHTLGSYSFVGAGAVVTRDVPDQALVIGNPARVAGWMCICATKLQFDKKNEAVCSACGASYVKADNTIKQVVPTI